MHTTHEETTDFNSKLQEISHIENGISHLKNAFQLLMTNTTGFKSIIQELTVSLKFLYNGNSPYYSLSSNMYNCYIQLEKLYSDFYENIKKLLTQLNELGNSYEYVDDLIDKRAERKKVFDYYGIPMDLSQYSLVGSTVRSYLAYLYDRDKAEVFFKDNKMYWQAK